MACSGCTGSAQSDVITIRMRIADEEVTFRRCGKCEANVWEDGEGRISLEEVLELARVSR